VCYTLVERTERKESSCTTAAPATCSRLNEPTSQAPAATTRREPPCSISRARSSTQHGTQQLAPLKHAPRAVYYEFHCSTVDPAVYTLTATAPRFEIRWAIVLVRRSRCQ
jgi:hypothetical protein